MSRHRGDLTAADEGVLRVLRASVTDLAARQSEVVLLVHQQIIERMPGVTAQLPANGRGVARRLVRALVEAALLDDRAAGSAELVRRIGAMDRDEGFGPEHYAATTQMLLHAVRGVYRGEWTSTLSSAWVEYLLWLREQLVAGSTGDAPPPGSSRPPAPDDVPHAEPDDLDDDLDDDEEPPAYGELMVSMTQASRRDRERRGRRGR